LSAQHPTPKGHALFSSARSLLTSNGAVGLIDQLLVSAVNFLALLILARSTSVAELGYYALSMSIIYVALSVQDSLVTRPYVVRLLKQDHGAERHAGNALLFSIAVAAVVLVMGEFLAGIVALHVFDISLQPGIVMAGGVAMPFMLLREFARRHAFANQDNSSALRLDVVASGLIIALFLGLACFGKLNAFNAVLTQGFAAGLTALAWWVRRRRLFNFDRKSAIANAVSNWSVGKWFLISQVAIQLNSYANHWISMFALGAAETGSYVAALSIVALTNPLVFGLFNILMPRSVHTLHGSGAAALRRQVERDTIMISALMAAIVAVLVALGPWLLGVLYKDVHLVSNADSRTLLLLIGLSALWSTATGTVIIGLQSVERAKLAAALTLGVFIVGAIASILLIKDFGLIGAAGGRLLADVAGFIASWAVLRKVVR
jgi:O-antigen/teichoic acid export membrane protein